MNRLPRVVFSATLPAALTRESGGEAMAHGGAAFVQALSRFGLIDEYRLGGQELS